MANQRSISRVGAWVFALALVACSGSSSGPSSDAPGRARRVPTQATDATVEAGVASLGDGGAALLRLLDDDAWMLHHGSTDVIRGKDPIGRYLADLASAYPKLSVQPRSTAAIDDEGWLVEAVMVDETRGATGRLIALLQTRRRAVVSVELFGDDPRTLSTETADASESLPSRMGLAAADTIEPELATEVLADHLEPTPLLESAEPPQIRLVAQGGTARLAIVVARGRDEHGVPMSLHAAMLEHRRDDGSTIHRVYANPRETTAIDMGNLTLGHEDLLRSKLHSDTLRWGAWQGYCCEHGVRTRSCRLIDVHAMPQCRERNRLAFVCRQAYHCSGPECFCCASGLDAACEMDDVPEVAPDVPGSKRPAAPTVWSPY